MKKIEIDNFISTLKAMDIPMLQIQQLFLLFERMRSLPRIAILLPQGLSIQYLVRLCRLTVLPCHYILNGVLLEFSLFKSFTTK